MRCNRTPPAISLGLMLALLLALLLGAGAVQAVEAEHAAPTTTVGMHPPAVPQPSPAPAPGRSGPVVPAAPAPASAQSVAANLRVLQEQVKTEVELARKRRAGLFAARRNLDKRLRAAAATASKQEKAHKAATLKKVLEQKAQVRKAERTKAEAEGKSAAEFMRSVRLKEGKRLLTSGTSVLPLDKAQRQKMLLALEQRERAASHVVVLRQKKGRQARVDAQRLRRSNQDSTSSLARAAFSSYVRAASADRDVSMDESLFYRAIVLHDSDAQDKIREASNEVLQWAKKLTK